MQMNNTLLSTVPNALTEIKLVHLFAMRQDSAAPVVVGQTAAEFRRVGLVTGGSFESRRDGLSGKVLGGGNDWQTVRPDDTTTLDVRIILQTDGGDLIAMTYKGLRHGPPDVMAKLDRGEQVDPSQYYFRLAPLFETASKRFAWLNKCVAIGTGHRLPDGPLYNIFEVL
jgi:hypothetical protein